MSDRCDLARGWLLKARSDLNACRRWMAQVKVHGERYVNRCAVTRG